MKKSRTRISLLVPFRTDHAERMDVWKWLIKYWRRELPDAEIVIGRDHGGTPFSKTSAINDAARRAHGDVFVVLDADCYIRGDVIAHCAARIRSARARSVPMWFVPYRHIYRLTQEATAEVLGSSPKNPYRFSEPPPMEDVEDTTGSLFGHKYGALIMIMPREAFETVGCMDPRFRGWGGEDVSLLRALDTLWARHKNTPSDVLHLYHPRQGQQWSNRTWEGQDKPRSNDWLAIKYNHATNKPIAMRRLVDDGCVSEERLGWLKRLGYWFLGLIEHVWELLHRWFRFA